MRPIKPLFCHSVKFRVLCGFISEWSHLYYCLGQQDNVLSDHGRQQARQVAARLAREPFTAVYSSDLLRASEVGKVDSGLVWTPGPPITPRTTLRHGMSATMNKTGPLS